MSHANKGQGTNYTFDYTMPWVPQIQKRVFKYILDRLALFSDVNLDDLAVQWGKTTNLSINNVNLDPDKINAPGLHLRSGAIASLKAGVSMTSVQLNCTGINLTVALELSDMEDNELSTFLSKTTDDLVSSLTLNGPEGENKNPATNDVDHSKDGDSQSSSGYGPGEFNIMSTITEMALNQLSVDIEGITINILINETDNLKLFCQSLSFRTVEGKHHIQLGEILIKTRGDTANTFNPGTQSSYQRALGFSNLALSTHEPPNKSLLQSTVIGDSMYMSAMDQSLAPPNQNDPKDTTGTVLCYIGSIEIVHQFNSSLNITIPRVVVALQDAVPILTTIASQSTLFDPRKHEPKEEVDFNGNYKRELVIKSCCLTTSAIREDGSHVSKKGLSLVVETVSTIGSATTLQRVRLLLNQLDILNFQRATNDADIEFIRYGVSLSIRAAHSAYLAFNEEAVLAILPLVEIVGQLAALGPRGSSATDVSPVELHLDLNSFTLSLLDEVYVRLDPIRCDKHLFLQKMDIDLGHECYAILENVQYHPKRQLKVMGKAKGTPVFGPLTEIQFFRAKISIARLAFLQEWYQRVSDTCNAHTGKQHTSFEQKDFMGLQVKRLKCLVDFGQPIGLFTLDLGAAQFFMGPQTNQASVGKVFVSRDFSDAPHVPLIYNADQSLTKGASVFVDLEHNTAELYNLALDFHPRLLEVIGSSSEEKRDSSEVSVISETLFSLKMADCVLGLSPIGMPSKAVAIVNNGNVVSHGRELNFNIGSLDLLLIDDVACLDLTNGSLGEQASRKTSVRFETSGSLFKYYQRQGYVPLGNITLITLRVSAATAIKAHVSSICLSSCADSTQILVQLINGLKPVDTEEASHAKFKVEHNDPSCDVMKEVDEFFFVDATELPDDDLVDDDVPSNLEFVESYFGGRPSKADFLLEQEFDHLSEEQNANRMSIFDQRVYQQESSLRFSDHHFNGDPKNKAEVPSAKTELEAYIDTFTWKLHDGYDWTYTKDTIRSSVEKIETVAKSLQEGWEKTDTAEPVVADYLFDSIYIGVPAGTDPENLHRAINETLEPRKPPAIQGNRRTLHLNRSENHRVLISLTQLKSNIRVHEEGVVRATVSIDVHDAEILDNMPSSTWNKFLTYQRRAGERESGSEMFKVKLDIVQPVDYSPATEGSLRVDVLPLRLHVDQDTSDFITRFFAFKDERFVTDVTEDLFLQKADIRTIFVDFDYKPKKVDYAGLKAGRTIEFMNFFPLERTDIKLKHVVLYGVNGLVPLSQQLNAIWIPDIVFNQRKEIISGISPIRSFARLGGGFKDLIWIPIEQYRADGRIVSGLQKGIWKFASNTANELAKFGAKFAAGTQTFLESMEEAMAGDNPYFNNDYEYEDEDASTGQRPVSSHYAHPPQSVNEALMSARDSMGRNFALARQAVQNIGTETAQRGSAQGAALAVAHQGPAAVLRPMIGASEAVSRAFMGVTNQMDPDQMEDIKEKYKH